MAGEPLVRGRADLAQPRLRHHVPEARDGREQPGLALPARGPARDPLIQASDRGSKPAIRSRCSRHSSAWCPVNRPASAIDRSASFPAVRIRPLARSASTPPRRSPSISASIIAVATPR